MTPADLKLVEKLWMWLTLVNDGAVPAEPPPSQAAADALKGMLDEYKAKAIVVPREVVLLDTQADPRAWPATNTAIKTLCDIWIARWGPGSAPGDVIRNAALTLKKADAPWDALVRSFQRYVDIVEDQFASPYAWRKKWRTYDPETPEHDAEGARIADSVDRQLRQRSKHRGDGGLQRVGETLKRLPEGRR